MTYPRKTIILETTKIRRLEIDVDTDDKTLQAELLTEEDFDWFVQSRLSEAIPEEARKHLFSVITPKQAPEGERFIHQGEEGDVFYIIRSGSCLVNIESEGSLYPVDTLGPGDVVGEMAVLTGEKRSANVDAGADTLLWQIAREDFDSACAQHPKLREFLTNVLCKRVTHELVSKGFSIGKYFLQRALGRGGTSVVFLGSHSTLGMPVAVKMLRHNMAMDPAFVAEFRNEAIAIAQLNHENIVKVYDVEELYRTFFIVMEYVEGRSLEYVVRRKERPTLEAAVNVILQVCSGLKHAHEKGLVHGDVKPGNILIEKDDLVKIVDFGLARAPGTQAKHARGSPLYMSPEQIRNHPVDLRTDIYSLGHIAYELITGERARRGTTVPDVLEQHLREPIKDPGSIIPDLPDELADFIVRATRMDPDERYSSVDQILHELEPLASNMGLTAKPRDMDRLNMMSLYLFYRGEHKAVMKKLVKDFSRELEKVGARLRGATFDNIQE